MNKALQTTIRILRRLSRNTIGNGEIVGVLAAVGIAVTAGYEAVNQIGTQAKSTGGQQASHIKGLPGN